MNFELRGACLQPFARHVGDEDNKEWKLCSDVETYHGDKVSVDGECEGTVQET